MAKVRSPNYPALDLAAAIELIRPVFAAENRNKMSRHVLGTHLGHASLNGRAITKIGAVRAYGLIDGSNDELRVSDDAIIVLNAPEDSTDRQEALVRCALRPNLFQELNSLFPTKPSEANLRYELVKLNFTQEASGKAADSYLKTMELANAWGKAYVSGSFDSKQEADLAAGEPNDRTGAGREQLGPGGFFPGADRASSPPNQAEGQASGTRREIITLDEGDVIITFPDGLSSHSFDDLKDHLDLFIKKMKRRSGASGQH